MILTSGSVTSDNRLTGRVTHRPGLGPPANPLSAGLIAHYLPVETQPGKGIMRDVLGNKPDSAGPYDYFANNGDPYLRGTVGFLGPDFDAIMLGREDYTILLTTRYGETTTHFPVIFFAPNNSGGGFNRVYIEFANRADVRRWRCDAHTSGHPDAANTVARSPNGSGEYQSRPVRSVSGLSRSGTACTLVGNDQRVDLTVPAGGWESVLYFQLAHNGQHCYRISVWDHKLTDAETDEVVADPDVMLKPAGSSTVITPTRVRTFARLGSGMGVFPMRSGRVVTDV